jgi:hypothetical protein
MRDELRLLRGTDVEEVHARRRHAGGGRLVSDRHDVADDVERVRAHLVVRELGLHHHLRLERVGHVDCGEVLGRRLVREPQDAPAVFRHLHIGAFADAAEAVELVMPEQLHVEAERLSGPRARA